MLARRIATIAIAAVTVVAIGRASAQSPDGPTIIGRASRIYKALGSFQADFREHLADEKMGDEDYKGSIAQQGPSRFAMRYTTPAGQTLVMDGTWFWIYTPVETPKQVIRTNPPTGPSYGSNLLGFFLDSPSERYRASWVREETVDGHTCDAVLLIPNSPDVPFKRATIWIDRDVSLPRRIQITEKTGVQRTLDFLKIRSNQQIPADVFKFTVPNGVKTISQ